MPTSRRSSSCRPPRPDQTLSSDLAYASPLFRIQRGDNTLQQRTRLRKRVQRFTKAGSAQIRPRTPPRARCTSPTSDHQHGGDFGELSVRRCTASAKRFLASSPVAPTAPRPVTGTTDWPPTCARRFDAPGKTATGDLSYYDKRRSFRSADGVVCSEGPLCSVPG